MEEAYTFFVSFTYIVSLIFLKIFIAIILNGYSSTMKENERLFNHEMSDKFSAFWGDYDPDATTYIALKDLREFLFALGPPLGFDPCYRKSKYKQDKFIASL